MHQEQQTCRFHTQDAVPRGYALPYDATASVGGQPAWHVSVVEKAGLELVVIHIQTSYAGFILL